MKGYHDLYHCVNTKDCLLYSNRSVGVVGAGCVAPPGLKRSEEKIEKGCVPRAPALG
jgi:hypothetical protein